MKRKFFIFLIPLFYALNYVFGHYLPSLLFMLFWLLAFLGVFVYPIINMFLFAFVFLDDKLLVWSCPLVAVFVTVWPYVWDGAPDQLNLMLLYAGIIYIPYSLICTVVAVFVRNRERKERGISDEKR